jgi:hypothetical protein
MLVNERRPRPHPQFGPLPAWQADLPRLATICTTHLHLLTHSNPIIVSDGSVEGGKGCFGVCLAVGKNVIACVTVHCPSWEDSRSSKGERMMKAKGRDLLLMQRVISVS